MLRVPLIDTETERPRFIIRRNRDYWRHSSAANFNYMSLSWVSQRLRSTELHILELWPMSRRRRLYPNWKEEEKAAAAAAAMEGRGRSLPKGTTA